MGDAGYLVSQGSFVTPFMYSDLAFDPLYVSTGSAGIIQTIQRFSHRALVAGILGIIATVGWAVQGLGNAFYYRQVVFFSAKLLRGYSLREQIWAHHSAAGHTMEKVRDRAIVLFA